MSNELLNNGPETVEMSVVTPELVAAAVYGRLNWETVRGIAATGFLPEGVARRCEESAASRGLTLSPSQDVAGTVGEALVYICREFVSIVDHQ